MKLNNIIFGSLFFASSLIASDFSTSFNYFGNLTGSTLNKDGFNTKGYQIDDVENHFRLSSYSKLGLQSTIYNDNFMFVAQVVAHYEEDNIRANLTWFNAKYNINSDFNIRIGRIQSSLFFNSDSRDIDYLHPWALEPSAFHGLMPMRYYEGIEFTYNKVIGDYYININLTPYAAVETDIDDLVENSILTAKDTFLISFTISNNNFKFKTSYIKSTVDIPIYDNDYHTVISILEAQGNNMDSYNYTNKKVSFLSAGLEYMYKNYYFITEIAKRESDSLLSDTLVYYSLLSYKYNDFTPFIMYACNDNEASYYDTTLINDPLTGGMAKIELEKILYSTNDSQKTISLGFRYDFKVGVVFKAQIDKTTIKDYGIDHSDTTKRLGFIERDAMIDDDSVYQAIIGLSFAF